MSIADVLKKEAQTELVWKQLLRKFPTIDKTYSQKISKLNPEVFEILTVDLLDMKDPKDLEKYF